MRYRAFTIVVCVAFWELALPIRVLGQSGGASLEELLKEAEPALSEQDSEVVARWNAVVSAFASDDEEAGKREATALTESRGRLNPRQVEAVGLLLRLANITDGVPADASVDQLRKQGQEALAELNKADAQLANVEARAAKLPKTFSTGSQVHVQWVQLQRENDHWKARKDEAQKRYDTLKTEYAKRKSALFGELEKQLLPLIDALASAGEIDAAIALANTYVRKNNQGAAVSDKGNELVELRKKEAFVRELVGAIEKEVEPLLTGRRLSAAAAKLEESMDLVRSRISDDRQKEIFTRLIQPLESKLEAVTAVGRKRLAEARLAVSKDVQEGRRHIALVEDIWSDNPELDSLRVKLASTERQRETLAAAERIAVIEKIAEIDLEAARGLFKKLELGLTAEERAVVAARLQALRNQLASTERQREALAAAERIAVIEKIAEIDLEAAQGLFKELELGLTAEERAVVAARLQALRNRLASTERQREALAAAERIAVIEKIAETDLTAAQGLFKELELGLTAEERAVVAARLQALRNRLWDAELDSLRADIDEAHRFLTTESAELAALFQKGDDPAFKGRLRNVGATENIIRARTLLEGVVTRGSLVETELKEPTQKARALALLETARKGVAMLTVEAERASRDREHFQTDSSASAVKAGLVGAIGGAAVAAALGILFLVKKRKS